MKAKVYIETSVVSYLTSATSHDLVVAAHQHVTREWWRHRERFDLFVSEVVLEEVVRGHQRTAARRLAVLHGLPVLAVDGTVNALARELLESRALPPKATADAAHVAVSSVNGLDYLLTWNCAHLANPATRAKIEQVCRSAAYTPPVLCTPEELGVLRDAKRSDR
jgi:predicted nucleic acid-binding protein